jgi:hypothetical protein
VLLRDHDLFKASHFKLHGFNQQLNFSQAQRFCFTCRKRQQRDDQRLEIRLNVRILRQNLTDKVDQAHLEQRDQARRNFGGPVKQVTNLLMPVEQLFRLALLLNAALEAGGKSLAE